MERYIIIDVPGLDGSRNDMANFGVEITDATEMTNRLIEWSGWYKFDPTTTLLVFPGNGADIVRRHLPSKWLKQWRWATAEAKRYWKPGQDPIVFAGRVFQGMTLGIKDMVIIDDVVSSGMTAKRLLRTNEPWIPGTKWHIASWMAQRACSLRGFTTCYAPVETGDQCHKVPINSISTLLSDSMIAKSYAHRNLGVQAETFLQVLEKLRQECLH